VYSGAGIASGWGWSGERRRLEVGYKLGQNFRWGAHRDSFILIFEVLSAKDGGPGNTARRSCEIFFCFRLEMA